MKVAVGGFIHEGNSFSAEKIGLQQFKDFIYTTSDVLVDRHRGDRRILGGFIDYAEDKGWDIVPLACAYAVPAGPIKAEAFQSIADDLCRPLEKEKVDGVLLHLHGAIVAEGTEDCEGEILTRMRGIIGDDVPMMMVNDLHANVSPAMTDNVNGIFGYNTQPHADTYDREYEAAELLDRVFSEGIETCCVMAQPPLLLPSISTDTERGAMKYIMDRVYEFEKDEAIINLSAFAGFYGSDLYNLGASAVAVTEKKDREKGMETAKKLADIFWDRKESFFVPTTPVEEAVKIADREGGLWCFIDEADDPMGGGPGDGTYLLRKLMDMGIRDAAVVTIHDPEIAEKAFTAGKGGTVAGMLGAKKDSLHGEPVSLNARVVALHEGKIPFVAWNEEDLQNPEKIAVLEQDGIYIVVTKLKTCTESIDIFKYLGMNADDFHILVMKGLGEAYQEVYQERAKGFLTMDSIGVTNPDVTKIGDFRNVRRPIYPLDRNVSMRYE